MKEKVALIAPPFFGYDRKIKSAIERAGYDCLLLNERVSNSFWIKILTRLRIIQYFPKIVRSHVDLLLSRLSSYEPEKVLVVDPETLGYSDIQAIRQVLPNARVIVYVWDSTEKKSFDGRLAESAHKAYSFDVVDCEASPVWTHVPLFHNHMDMRTEQSGTNDFEYSFIGTVRFRRIQLLSKLARQLLQINKSYFFYLYSPSWIHYLFFKLIALCYGYAGILSHRKIEYSEYTKVLLSSKCVIDIEQDVQTGMTMRTIEAVFTGTPLLTTNKYIGKYDFYKCYPIKIWDISSEQLPDIGECNFYNDPVLFSKYSIDRWVQVLLTEQEPKYFSKVGTGERQGDRMECMEQLNVGL